MKRVRDPDSSAFAKRKRQRIPSTTTRAVTFVVGEDQLVEAEIKKCDIGKLRSDRVALTNPVTVQQAKEFAATLTACGGLTADFFRCAYNAHGTDSLLCHVNMCAKTFIPSASSPLLQDSNMWRDMLAKEEFFRDEAVHPLSETAMCGLRHIGSDVIFAMGEAYPSDVPRTTELAKMLRPVTVKVMGEQVVSYAVPVCILTNVSEMLSSMFDSDFADARNGEYDCTLSGITMHAMKAFIKYACYEWSHCSVPSVDLCDLLVLRNLFDYLMVTDYEAVLGKMLLRDGDAFVRFCATVIDNPHAHDPKEIADFVSVLSDTDCRRIKDIGGRFEKTRGHIFGAAADMRLAPKYFGGYFQYIECVLDADVPEWQTIAANAMTGKNSELLLEEVDRLADEDPYIAALKNMTDPEIEHPYVKSPEHAVWILAIVRENPDLFNAAWAHVDEVIEVPSMILALSIVPKWTHFFSAVGRVHGPDTLAKAMNVLRTSSSLMLAGAIGNAIGQEWEGAASECAKLFMGLPYEQVFRILMEVKHYFSSESFEDLLTALRNVGIDIVVDIHPPRPLGIYVIRVLPDPTKSVYVFPLEELSFRCVKGHNLYVTIHTGFIVCLPYCFSFFLAH